MDLKRAFNSIKDILEQERRVRMTPISGYAQMIEHGERKYITNLKKVLTEEHKRLLNPGHFSGLTAVLSDLKKEEPSIYVRVMDLFEQLNYEIYKITLNFSRKIDDIDITKIRNIILKEVDINISIKFRRYLNEIGKAMGIEEEKRPIFSRLREAVGI